MENLIEKAKEGNREAHNAICSSIRKDLLGYCFTLTKCKDSAEDLTQEVLITVIGKISQFNGTERGIGSWAKSIARNRFIDDTRKAKRLPVVAFESMEFSLSDSPEYYRSLEIEESAGKIREFMKVVKGLPPKTQEVFTMRYLKGIKHSDISKTLGINEGTSKSQCHKGREKVVEALGKDFLLV